MKNRMMHHKKRTLGSIINGIIGFTDQLMNFWSSAKGWAPLEAAELLSKSRLDWQCSLSRCLKLWIEPPTAEFESGKLILAWSNLGSLVEGLLKLFLSVWYKDYKNDVEAIKRKNNILDPDELNLEKLRIFFKKCIWKKSNELKWNDWILDIQRKRNAIHAFKDRDIGKFTDLHKNLEVYYRFLQDINDRLPYPGDEYKPYPFIH